MIATLALTVAFLSGDCAVFEKRANALATPHTDDAGEGLVQYVSTKKSWHGGSLTYGFLVTDSPHPVCSGQVLSVVHDGFRWRPNNHLAFEAIATVFDATTARDFANSHLVAKTLTPVQDRSNPMRWYLGKTYGYQTLTSSNDLTIMTLPEFKAALAQAQHASRSIH